jgi:hypothetical protein
VSAAVAILAELSSRGLHIEPRPNGNLYIAPKDLLTPELLERVRAHKAALLAHLRASGEQAEVDRIARLDAERREADRQATRGYDFDLTAPSHAEYLRREADPLADPGHPAYSIVITCQRYGVALRIDPDGSLVVGKAGAKAEEPSQPWPSLLRAIEAHLEAVARLVEGGWTLRADFPQSEVA